tara:strand:+ start:1300 stop:3633 length:2334 start_codon:yes stop_codon:yes gene_type:complete
MSLITLLTANRSLTKTYYADGKIDSYPLVRDFSSEEFSYETITELLTIFKLGATTGSCMLKGHLSKIINDEPRAGLTNATAPTDLLIIDYDSDEGFDSVTDLLNEIDPALPQTDYIFQHSASAGIKGAVGIRGHIFIRLSEPISPILLKAWLKKVNLTSNRFKNRIKLSRNAMSLCYALDITVNQNDKLIYITAPNLVGIKDPIKERFELHMGTARSYAFNSSVSAEVNRTKEHECLEAMQVAAGFKKRAPKYKMLGDGEVITNPAVCEVTGIKQQPDSKFVQLNLNGGDSWAYWYPKDNPEILYNFKGEPNVYLKDVAPEYYEQIHRIVRAPNIRPFVFRDLKSDIMFNAEYDEITNRVVTCHATNKRQNLVDFMVQRGMPAPKVIADWNVLFNPKSPSPVNFELKEMNLFQPSVYLQQAFMVEEKAKVRKEEFPIIHKTLSHICVDSETFEHFMDWLAHIVQFRTKTQTAWVFQGTEGTGKGTLYHQILVPILGLNQCFLLNQGQAEEQFNGFLQHNLMLFIDECDMDNSAKADKLLAKLRTIITEPTVPLRMMRSNSVNIENHSNLIIATNQSLPTRITEGDRRYNIAPRQNYRLVYDESTYELIESELSAFVTYLKQRPITENQVRTTLKNEARADLLALGMTVADEFFEALKLGDLDYFAERLQTVAPIPDFGYIAFAKIIQSWMETSGESMVTAVDDLVTVYKYIGGNDSMNTKKFGHVSGRHGFKARKTRIESIQRRVFDITFKKRDYSKWLNRNTTPNNVIKLQKVIAQ